MFCCCLNVQFRWTMGQNLDVVDFGRYYAPEVLVKCQTPYDYRPTHVYGKPCWGCKHENHWHGDCPFPNGITVKFRFNISASCVETDLYHRRYFQLVSDQGGCTTASRSYQLGRETEYFCDRYLASVCRIHFWLNQNHELFAPLDFIAQDSNGKAIIIEAKTAAVIGENFVVKLSFYLSQNEKDVLDSKSDIYNFFCRTTAKNRIYLIPVNAVPKKDISIKVHPEDETKYIVTIAHFSKFEKFLQKSI